MTKRLAVLFCASLLVGMQTTTATAEHPLPTMPEGGISWYYQTECTDALSGENGVCYVGVDNFGTQYVSFWVGDELASVRKVVGDSFEVLWERHPGEPT